MEKFEDRLERPNHIILREISGEAVILNLENENYHGFDETGLRMWKALTETDSVQDAYELLLDEFEVEPEQLQMDFRIFIDGLLSRGLMVAVETK